MSELEHIGDIIMDIMVEEACPHCGNPADRLRVTPGPHPGGHHARLDCDRCHCFVKWLPRPRLSGERSRKGQAELLRKHSAGICEMCQRESADLPLPQVLEVHHVTEVQGGGTDERKNLWIVCTPCHRLIHHTRTYLGHYHRKEVTS